jgi:hypothetical protein
VVTLVIAVAALALSVVSLLMQRKAPYLEAQFLAAGSMAAVTIRNSGERTARAPWVMVAAKSGEMSFCDHAGSGFLAPDSARMLITDVAFPRRPEVVGVVGFLDRRGRTVVRKMGDSTKRKRLSEGTSFEDAFRSFYPDQLLGPQAGKASDKLVD